MQTTWAFWHHPHDNTVSERRRPGLTTAAVDVSYSTYPDTFIDWPGCYETWLTGTDDGSTETLPFTICP